MDDPSRPTVAPVVGPGRHPRRAGFRDGLVAAGVLVGLALATGALSLPGGAANGPRPTGTAAPTGNGLAVGSDALGTAGPDQSGGSTVTPGPPSSAAPPAVDPLTLVYLPKDGIPRGTDMTEGCGFLFDLGPGGSSRISRSCLGPEGPSGALGTLFADSGGVLYVENAEFTPSTGPGQPAVACGRLSGQPPAFIEDPSCLIAYATSANGEFAFRLPARRGRWVVAVRGCESRFITACGAWYAEVDTLDPAPTP